MGGKNGISSFNILLNLVKDIFISIDEPKSIGIRIRTKERSAG